MKTGIVLGIVFAIGTMAFASPASAHSHKAGPEVRTEQGMIQGKLSEDGQVRIFLGIPYAAPPVGRLRWRPPHPPAKWHGIRPATEFGHRCVQFYDVAIWAMVFRDAGESEDCLTLNVWSPVRKAGEKTKAGLPVMVWIFGGGFIAGGASEPRQDGTVLAHKGVIVVSMNYRLGAFGFLATRELAAESPHHVAGNYGLLDQVTALQWVRQNIAAFGGDPGNVTIFGESAGSFSVCLQMAMPMARGLFARAIGESGSAFPQPDYPIPSLAIREDRDEKFALASFGTTAPAALRALSVASILRASKADPEFRFGPNLNRWILPRSIPEIYGAGEQAQVSLLAGWNKDEVAFEVLQQAEQPTAQNWRTLAKKQFGEDADEFLKAYPAAGNQQALRSAEDFSGDRFVGYSTWAWIEAQAKTGNSPVYRYFFTRAAPQNPFHSWQIGAFHSDEIEFVFGTLDSRRGVRWQPEDYKLSELMQTYWTNFAKAGNPNGPGLPHWPVYGAGDHWQVMRLDTKSQAEPDPYRNRYVFLQRVWAGK